MPDPLVLVWRHVLSAALDLRVIGRDSEHCLILPEHA